MRVPRTADGHIAVSLPRPTDLDLVAPLVGHELDEEPWSTLLQWASERSTADAAERLELLGLAGGAVEPLPAEVAEPVPPPLTPRSRVDGTRVVDLSTLWAGPLCGQLLARRGAEVVKVENPLRPDGVRTGSPAHWAELNADKQLVELEPRSQRDELVRLLRGADLVIESSRPRAWQQLGVVAEEVVASGTAWLSITARGRASSAIGFGDDVAARAGHVVADGAELLPVGDALGDPLTGVAAALEATDLLVEGVARLVEVSMFDVCRQAAAGPVEEHEVFSLRGRWWVDTPDGPVPVVEPW